MADDQMIPVPQSELEALRDFWWPAGRPGLQPPPPLGNLIARIPEPEWVPTEEQIEAYRVERGWKSYDWSTGNAAAVEALKAAAKVLGYPPAGTGDV